MIKRAEKSWREKIKSLSDKDLLPQQWVSEAALAEWIQAIDPYLLLHTPAKLHQLLGKRKNGRWILPLPTAQRLMLNQTWENEKTTRLKECFGEDLKRLGKKAMMQLERGVDEMDIRCIAMALEMAGIWQKGFKITRVDGDKQAEAIVKLYEKYKKFKGKDVRNLKGDN